jgi:hypothetical protein
VVGEVVVVMEEEEEGEAVLVVARGSVIIGFVASLLTS